MLNSEICSSKEAFESDNDASGVVARVEETVGKGSSQRSFDIPPGTSAIKLHIDENENGELDTNFLGIPKEQYGTSNNLLFLDFEAVIKIDTPLGRENDNEYDANR